MVSPRFAMDFLLQSTSGQIGAYALGLFSGIAETGALRVAQLPMSPTSVWIQASRLLVLPKLGEAEGKERANRVKRLSQAAVVAPVTAYTVVAYVALLQVGDSIFGDAWQAAEAALLPVGVAAIARATSAVSLMTVQARSDGSTILRTRSADSFITLVSIVGGAFAFGVEGAAWGHALANGLAATLWARLANRYI